MFKKIFFMLPLILFGCSDQTSEPLVLNDKTISSDIDNFLVAYQAIKNGAEPVEAIQTIYFDAGTAGLKDFIDLRITSAEKMAEALEKWPEVYESIPDLSQELPSLMGAVEEAFSKMQELYPETVIPMTYLLLGRRTSGGTVSENGLLIGIEVFYNAPEVIPPLIAHEMIHFQQTYIGDEDITLLGQAIKEGGADYLGELISGGIINNAAHDYGLPNECRLWAEFQGEMRGTDFGGWLYGKPEDLAGVWDERPNDLGYFIGYKITQAYFESSVNQKEAADDYLNITDFKDFLEKSRYLAKMEACIGE